METEVIVLAHSCHEFFPVFYMAKDLIGAVGMPIGDTTMNVSIHQYNAGALVFLDTLPLQLTPCRNYYASKTIYFCEETHKKEIISVKINKAEQFGDIFTKGLGRVLFGYLQKNLTLW